MSSEMSQRNLNEAFADIKYERYLDALEKLDNIIKERERVKDYMYYEALFGKAKVYYHIKDYERCVKACNEILSVDISDILKKDARNLRQFCFSH